MKNAAIIAKNKSHTKYRMTPLEYIERDIKKRACAASQAIRKPNVTEEELNNVKMNLAVAIKIKDILERSGEK